MTNLEKYQEIQAYVQKEIEANFEPLYKQFATKYGVSSTPLHRHNGADSPTIGNGSINNFASLPATTNSVANPAYLGTQIINNPAQANNRTYAGSFNSNLIYVMPIPVVYGFGTTTTVMMTGSPGAGATTATLTAMWGGATGTYTSRFASGEQRNVRFTNGSTSISWTPALVFASGGTTLTITASSRFKGGNAPVGSMVIFVNGDDGIRQLWIRADVDIDPINGWFGLDFAELAPLNNAT